MNSSLRSQETDGTKGRGCMKRNLHGAALCSNQRKRESGVCLVPFVWSLSRRPRQQRGSFQSQALDQEQRQRYFNVTALSGSNSTHIWKQITVMFIGRNTPVCGPQLFTTHNRVSHPHLCGCWCLWAGQR